MESLLFPGVSFINQCVGSILKVYVHSKNSDL